MIRVERHLARMTDGTRAVFRRLLQAVRYELLPLENTLEQSAHLPPGVEVAVTADPERGMGPTIDLAVELSRRGYDPIPHLAAQLIVDRADLESHLVRLAEAGVERALVVGGVADAPGVYPDAAALLDAIEEIGSSLREVGIAGYPQGHHVIPDEPIDRSLVEKAPQAGWITTQICFDVPRLEEWIGETRAAGVHLPIWLGIPAVADLTGLMSLGMRIGAGRSLQFMFEHPRVVSRLLRPGGRKASELVLELSNLATDESLGIAGFHLFTYNQVRAAERWRRRLATWSA